MGAHTCLRFWQDTDWSTVEWAVCSRCMWQTIRCGLCGLRLQPCHQGQQALVLALRPRHVLSMHNTGLWGSLAGTDWAC
jgi:hypothetical protein